MGGAGTWPGGLLEPQGPGVMQKLILASWWGQWVALVGGSSEVPMGEGATA